MKAVILAAGKGKRLQPLSNHITKAMMPIANVPITQRLIEQIHKETGINEYIILANGKEQDIVKHFIDLARHDEYFGKMRFEFIYQSEQKGMGHAVKCVLAKIRFDEPFLLAACDSLYPNGDIKKLMLKYNSSVCDGVFSLIEMPTDKMAKSSSVEIECGYVKRIIEKPSSNEILSNYASLPLYILKPDLMKYLNSIKPSIRGELELQDALQAWLSSGGVFPYEIMSGRETITTIADLLALNMKYLRDISASSENAWNEVMIVEPVLSGAKIRIGINSVIGPYVVIGESSRIGKDCTIKNAVIFAGSIVPDGTSIKNGCWHENKFFPV